METLINDRKIKDLFKQAIIEVIEEKKEVVHDFLDCVKEAIEDVELAETTSRIANLKKLKSASIAKNHV